MVKGILFDSGRVLNFAVTGSWSYSPNFFQIVGKNNFFEFFSILSNELPELNIDSKKKRLLTDDFVRNYNKYSFYEDVFEVLPRLSKENKLCIVSDAWPSLREVYREVGLESYFQYMVISSELGVNKPDKQMYLKALEKLELKIDEVIFVDDNPRNCKAANELGIRSIILDRRFITRIYNKFTVKNDFKIIKNLYELEDSIK